jgi:serine/threonine-protein kinase RsbW
LNRKKFNTTSVYDNVVPVIKEIREFLLANNVAEKTSSESEICLLEALNNTIKHGYEGQSGNKIIVEVAVDINQIEFRLIDYGRSRENIKKPKLEFDPDDIQNLPESGMGLYIIDTLMDETFYSSYGKENIFTMIKKN